MKKRFWIRQAWTIAKIELRRAFFSKRAFWVYGLALFPAVIFFGHAVEVKIRRDRLSARGFTPAALIDSTQNGETSEDVVKRLGKPARDQKWESRRRVRAKDAATGITTHMIDPAVNARFV